MLENGKRKMILLSIIIIVLFQESFIYLSSSNTINLLSISGLVLFIINIKNILKKQYSFKNLILTFILIQLFGIFLAKIYYGQSVLMGIYGAHYIFIYGWYFFIVDLMRIKTPENYEIYANYLKKYLVRLGLFIVVIIIIQGFLYNKIIFLNLKYSVRNGLRISGCYIALPTFIFLLVDVLKKFNIKKVIAICIVIYYFIKFNQSRSLIIILIISIIFLYIRSLKLKKFKLNIKDIFILYIGIIIIIVTHKYWSSIILELIEEITMVKNTGGVRIQEIQYYYGQLKEKKFLGIGILAYEFPLTKIIYGTVKYYYLEDIGMFSMLFQTGILSAIWLICFFTKFLKVIKMHGKDYWSLLGYIYFYKMLVGFLTIQIFNNKYSLIYFIIILAMLETNINNKKYNN